MLWLSALNILNSNVNEYSTTDIFNSNVDKYYVAKKTYGISNFVISEQTSKMNLNQCIHIFLFKKKKKMYRIPDLHFTVKIHRSIIQ